MNPHRKPTDTFMGLTDIELLAARGDERRQIFRRRLWERDAGICGICRELVELDNMDIDHIHPQSLGGADHWDNFRVTHPRCNRSRHRREFPKPHRTPPEEVAVTVRFPPQLLAQVRQLAVRDRRSLNSEIVILVERSVIAALGD